MSADPSLIAQLNMRNQVILAALAEGLSRKEIAWRLNYSYGYIRHRLNVIYARIGADNGIDAVLALSQMEETAQMKGS